MVKAASQKGEGAAKEIRALEHCMACTLGVSLASFAPASILGPDEAVETLDPPLLEDSWLWGWSS
jgi:hypothetical protein